MTGEIFEQIQGQCPMGCGRTLFVGSGGYLTCTSLSCPRPTAAHEVLALDHYHRVDVRAHDFTVEHPLRERVTGVMRHCSLHGWLLAQDGPPVALGRYIAIAQEGDPIAPWLFLDEATFQSPEDARMT